MKKKFFTNFIYFLFHFLIFTVPFLFTWVNEELFEFPKMLFVYVMTVLITSSWIIKMLLEKKIIFKRSKFDYFLLLFLLSQLVSTITSIHLKTSLSGYYSRFHGGLFSTISYLLLYFAFVSNINKKQLSSFFYTLLFSSFLVSLYAIPEHFGHSFSCLLMFKQFNASCWKQDVVTRVFASFGQPNWLAAYAVTVLPLTLSLLLMRIKHAGKFISLSSISLVISGLLFTTLLFTKSRSGFLAFVFSVALYLLSLGFLKIKKFNLKQFLVLLLIFLAIALGFGTSYSPSLQEILKTKSESNNSPLVEVSQGGTDSGEIRKIVWRGAIEVWKRYPLFGSGVETFAYSYYLDRPVEHNLVSEWDFLYNKAHNEFLNFLATTGIFGVTSYTLIILSFLFFSSKYLLKNKAADNNKLLALGLLSGYVALAVSNFFGFSTVTVGLLFFLYPAFFMILSDSEIAVKKTININKIGQFILATLTLLAASYLLLSIFTLWLADFNYAKAKNYISEAYLPEAIERLQTAITLSPNEAIFYNQFAIASSKLAIVQAQVTEPNSQLVAQLVEQAILASDISMALNPVHNTLYKSRARLFITLSQLNPDFLKEAETTLQQAITLAPTDPQLFYYLGTVQLALGDTEAGTETLTKTLELKPDYSDANIALESLNTEYETKP